MISTKICKYIFEHTKCHFLIQTGGGSGTPCRVEAIVNTAWSNSNSTLSILHNSYPNFITDIRVVRNGTTNKSYVDIRCILLTKWLFVVINATKLVFVVSIELL